MQAKTGLGFKDIKIFSSSSNNKCTLDCLQGILDKMLKNCSKAPTIKGICPGYFETL